MLCGRKRQISLGRAKWLPCHGGGARDELYSSLDDDLEMLDLIPEYRE